MVHTLGIPPWVRYTPWVYLRGENMAHLGIPPWVEYVTPGYTTVGRRDTWVYHRRCCPDHHPFHCWARKRTSAESERNPLQKALLYKDACFPPGLIFPFHCWINRRNRRERGGNTGTESTSAQERTIPVSLLVPALLPVPLGNPGKTGRKPATERRFAQGWIFLTSGGYSRNGRIFTVLSRKSSFLRVFNGVLHCSELSFLLKTVRIMCKTPLKPGKDGQTRESPLRTGKAAQDLEAHTRSIMAQVFKPPGIALGRAPFLSVSPVLTLFTPFWKGYLAPLTLLPKVHIRQPGRCTD